MIEASVVADSISEAGKRLTTFKLRYPKFIHGEFMTHRVISRNASSSRAIPTAKLIEEVRSDALRATPVFWGRNQAGMQAAEELDDVGKKHLVGRMIGDEGRHVTDREYAQDLWKSAAFWASNIAKNMTKIGAHKADRQPPPRTVLPHQRRRDRDGMGQLLRSSPACGCAAGNACARAVTAPPTIVNVAFAPKSAHGGCAAYIGFVVAVFIVYCSVRL